MIACRDVVIKSGTVLALSLTHLVILNCTSSHIVNTEETLGRLTKLKSLSFVPHLDGPAPAYQFLSSLTALETLILNNNNLRTRSIDSRLDDASRRNLASYVPCLSSLRCLSVPCMSLGFPASLLARMTRLTSLDIGYRNDRDDVEAVRHLTNLTHLDFNGHRGGLTISAMRRLRDEGALSLLRTWSGNIV